MKRKLLIVLILFVLILGLFILRYGSVLTQEGNPIPILTSIIKLELLNSDYMEFSTTNFGNRYVSENVGNSRYDVVKKFMKEKGWDFKDQMGAGLVFEKNEDVITIGTRQYSKHYFLWDVPNGVFK